MVVHCNFTDGVPKTCLLPVQRRAELRSWSGDSIWFSSLSGGFQVLQGVNNPQLHQNDIELLIPFLQHTYEFIYITFLLSFSFPMMSPKVKCSSFKPVLIMLLRASNTSAATLQHLLSFAPAMGRKLVPVTLSTMGARYIYCMHSAHIILHTLLTAVKTISTRCFYS